MCDEMSDVIFGLMQYHLACSTLVLHDCMITQQLGGTFTCTRNGKMRLSCVDVESRLRHLQ